MFLTDVMETFIGGPFLVALRRGTESVGCLVLVLLLLLAVWLIYRLLHHFYGTETVYEYERGLRYYKGKFDKILEPGYYRYYRKYTYIRKIDMRTQFLTVMGQELLTLDSMPLKISLIAEVQVTNPHTAVTAVTDYMGTMYFLLQSSLREVTSSVTIDDLLEKREEIGKKIEESTKSQFETYGLRLGTVKIRDIMLSGDLKKKYADVTIAKREGLAALERARGETAALRNLANAARMMEKNPYLAQLRMLQTMGESKGNTFVIGFPPSTVPLPVKGTGSGESGDETETKEDQV